ncbi:protein anon-73B1 [Glossina fuscipes fuscipes]|uniref:Protein anon-73B1 n=1 Tax=Glossina palpalis gambiensis TaxID=67801 RepID=A0A1B0B176_9MUSC
MATNTANPLDKYGEDDFFSIILRYGLYFGAFFQLACISASIILPMFEKDNVSFEISEDLKNRSGDAQTNSRRSHKLRKQEKKKRR